MTTGFDLFLPAQQVTVSGHSNILCPGHLQQEEMGRLDLRQWRIEVTGPGHGTCMSDEAWVCKPVVLVTPAHPLGNIHKLPLSNRQKCRG